MQYETYLQVHPMTEQEQTRLIIAELEGRLVRLSNGMIGVCKAGESDPGRWDWFFLDELVIHLRCGTLDL